MNFTMIGCQIYPWSQHFAGKPASQWRSEALSATKAAGATLWEDMLPESVTEIETLGHEIQAAGLRAETIYTNATMHDESATQVIDSLVERMRAAAEFGVKILVLNPMPLSWTGHEDKSDGQLRTQARSMDILGAKLRRYGLELAYHTHSVEMRQAAREFHHTLLATDPDLVGLCLDAHWIYRGAGNSEVALHDIISLYAKRIRSYHLRQSQHGVWSEVFGPGDIDYKAIDQRMRELRLGAPFIIEQAIEKGTPRTMEMVEALRRGVEYAREVFVKV